MIRSPKSPQAIGPDLTLPTVEQIAEMPAEQLVGVARHLGVLYVAVMARLATGAQEGRYERGAGAPIVTAQGPASGRYENPVAGTFVTDFAERRRPCGHTLRECGGPCDGCGRCGCRRSNACRQKAYRRRQKAHREDPEVRAAEIARLERWVARARGEAARMEAEAAE